MLPFNAEIGVANKRLLKVQQFLSELPREDLECLCRMVMMQRSQLAWDLSELRMVDISQVTTGLPTDANIPGFAYTQEELEKAMEVQDRLAKVIEDTENSN